MLFNTDGIGSSFIPKECRREEMISCVNVFPISKRAAGCALDINCAHSADFLCVCVLQGMLNSLVLGTTDVLCIFCF